MMQFVDDVVRLSSVVICHTRSSREKYMIDRDYTSVYDSLLLLMYTARVDLYREFGFSELIVGKIIMQ